MSEPDFRLPASLSKAERYEAFMPSFAALVEGHLHPVSLLANAAAALHEAFGFFWVGFYLVRGEELILGPFQGSPACTSIPKGRGVCGTAWAQGQTLLVPDVDLFPGHIACSSLSRSEIVIPLHRQGEILGVLDIDSTLVHDFDTTDQVYLEQVAHLVARGLRPL